MSCSTNGLNTERHHQRKGRRKEHRRKSSKHRSTCLQRRNFRMRKPITELCQQRKHHWERNNRQELSPKKFRRCNRRKLQKFKRIAFAFARKTVARQRRTHRSHQATEQEHHVAFHAIHNLATVTRHSYRLTCRKNHRRNDERNPETRIPKY